MRRWAISLVALIFAVSLVSSAQQQTGGGKYDQQIQRDINKYLQGHSDRFKNVQASVEDGVVSLQGTVDRLIDKLDADKKAHGIDHVTAVRNDIQVSGTKSDAELQQGLANKLRYDRIGYGIVFNSLTLGVQNGVVTVGGSVNDYP